MEIQLQELIDQIKTDGVAAAESEAAAKIAAANAEAEKIISDAKAEAETLLAQAREETKRMAAASEDAIRQAGRNLLISFRESVNQEVNAITNQQVEAGFSREVVSQLIPKVVEAWAGNAGAEDVSVLLNSKDLADMEKSLLAALQEKMLGGVTLQASENIQGGFRISVKNGQAYYDYSTEAVVNMFSAYLNPRVSALLKEAGSL